MMPNAREGKKASIPNKARNVELWTKSCGFSPKTKNLNWLIVPEEGLEPPTCGL